LGTYAHIFIFCFGRLGASVLQTLHQIVSHYGLYTLLYYKRAQPYTTVSTFFCFQLQDATPHFSPF
jgi:hypothetical protein